MLSPMSYEPWFADRGWAPGHHWEEGLYQRRFATM